MWSTYVYSSASAAAKLVWSCSARWQPVRTSTLSGMILPDLVSYFDLTALHVLNSCAKVARLKKANNSVRSDTGRVASGNANCPFIPRESLNPIGLFNLLYYHSDRRGGWVCQQIAQPSKRWTVCKVAWCSTPPVSKVTLGSVSKSGRSRPSTSSMKLSLLCSGQTCPCTLSSSSPILPTCLGFHRFCPEGAAQVYQKKRSSFLLSSERAEVQIMLLKRPCYHAWKTQDQKTITNSKPSLISRTQSSAITRIACAKYSRN